MTSDDDDDDTTKMQLDVCTGQTLQSYTTLHYKVVHIGLLHLSNSLVTVCRSPVNHQNQSIVSIALQSGWFFR